MSNMRILLLLSTFILLFVQHAGALKILMYSPRFGRSHVMFVGKLADQLAEAGHEVVLYQPISNKEVENLVGAKNVRVIERRPNFELEPPMANMDSAIWHPDAASLTRAVYMLGALGKKFRIACEESLRDIEMMERLKKEQFDIGISEFFDVCGHGIFKRIGLEKTIVLYASAMPLDDATFFGLPNSASFVYDFVSRNSLKGFWGRFQNYIGLIVGRYFLMKEFLGQTAEAYKVFDENLDYKELIANSSYAFVNMDEHLDIPRPISHKFINIAGVGMQKALKNTKSLDKEYQQIFDSAKLGVIYISFGSVAKSYSMPKESKKAFLEAFSEFPDINFIWKYEKPEHKISENTSNLFEGTWLPQKEIMGHPKLLAFITHGGANSITEASYAGKPLIVIPLFGDQNRNALMLEERGIGLEIDKSALTKENIVNAIRKVVYEPNYMQKAKELSEIIRNKPMNPDDVFVKHVEFAAKYNVHEALDMRGRHLSTIQYYNLDIIALLLSIVTLILTVSFFILRFIVRRFLCRTNVRKSTKVE